MKSNSNFNITKATVDPISQEITSLEINGEKFTSGEGPSEDYEVWYVGNIKIDGSDNRVGAINANPYGPYPAITHFLLAFDPQNTGDMKWKKYEAYNAEVKQGYSGHGLIISFDLNESKTSSASLYANNPSGTMSKCYIKSSDIIDA
jgi:hypothetical protein